MMIRKRPVPIRSCVACGRKTHKNELIRIVKEFNQDTVTMDLTGKLDGRGAYICKESQCRITKLTLRHVEHALRTKLNKNQWATFVSSITSLDNAF